MGKKKWFISHSSSSPDATPGFFMALEKINAESNKIELVMPPPVPMSFPERHEQIKNADLVIAEVSVASTGSGIDLGLAHAAEKSIIAFHQGTGVISPVISTVATAIHVYLTEDNITNVLKTLA